jgi:hypothetical protein
MRSFVVACIAALIIAAAGAAVLNIYQKSAAVAFSSDGVRI